MPSVESLRTVLAPVLRWPARTASRFRRAWQFLSPFLGNSKWMLSLLVVVSVLTGLSEAAILGLVAHVATSLAARGMATGTDLGPFQLDAPIATLLVVAFIIAVIRLALQLVAAYLPARMTADAQVTLRRKAFDGFIGAEWAVRAQEREGHLQEVLTSHVLRAAQGVMVLANGLSALVTMIALVVSAFIVSLSAAAVTVLAGIFLFGVLRPLGKRNRQYARRHSESNINYAEAISESVRMAEETHVFGASSSYLERVDSLNEEVRHWQFRTQLLQQIVTRTYQSLAILLIVLGLVGVYLVGGQRLTALGAVVLMLIRTLSYGQQTQTAYQKMNDLLPFMENIHDRIQLYQRRHLRSGSERLTSIGALKMESVRFEYRRGEPVLHDVSVEAEAGSAIGVVGPSGAGKSTLVQILLRLRDPDDGKYLVNGRAARAYRSEDWRRRVAYVPQEPRVLRATVAENVRFFRPDVSDEQIERAARLAHIHEEIVSWPDGYETIIGQRADAVSGGQRQRLCLARALVGRPGLLVLDEPTSALDVASERLIQRSLEGLRGDITLFIVAHRLSTLDVCDRVLVLIDGRVEAFAPPEELAVSDNFYAQSLELTADPDAPIQT